MSLGLLTAVVVSIVSRQILSELEAALLPLPSPSLSVPSFQLSREMGKFTQNSSCRALAVFLNKQERASVYGEESN